MGSVLSDIKCPCCEGQAMSDFYYNTGEETVFCGHCGYQYEGRYKRDENSKLVTKDGTDNYKFDNLIWTETVNRPLACYHVKFKGVIVTQTGGLDTPEEIESFKTEVERRKKEIQLAKISWYDDISKTTSVEVLI